MGTGVLTDLERQLIQDEYLPIRCDDGCVVYQRENESYSDGKCLIHSMSEVFYDPHLDAVVKHRLIPYPLSFDTALDSLSENQDITQRVRLGLAGIVIFLGAVYALEACIDYVDALVW